MEEIFYLCWESKPSSSLVHPVIISTGSSRHLAVYGHWNITKIWTHFRFFYDFRGQCGLIFELGNIWKVVFYNSPILDFSVFLTILYGDISFLLRLLVSYGLSFSSSFSSSSFSSSVARQPASGPGFLNISPPVISSHVTPLHRLIFSSNKVSLLLLSSHLSRGLPKGLPEWDFLFSIYSVF